MTVVPRKEVIAIAKRCGKSVLFGSLMELRHVKNAEVRSADPNYKGRLVFRGDTVKDETGYYAVFSEQGTSASQLAAAKVVDAIARCPGCSGADSDARGAYTQVSLLKAHLSMGGAKENFVETWISFENMPWRRPKSWDKIEDPVCVLRLNLYGHPLAGMLRETFCQNIFIRRRI